MFCFGNAAPYFEGQIIENSREDYRAAVRFGDVRCGQKAIYFHHDGALYYLPYTCIDETTGLVLNEHHSCCSGDSTMEVHNQGTKSRHICTDMGSEPACSLCYAVHHCRTACPLPFQVPVPEKEDCETG